MALTPEGVLVIIGVGVVAGVRAGIGIDIRVVVGAGFVVVDIRHCLCS